ncbi:MAG TPA: thermonuclease family protein [Kribbella sp.]|nr:thermonuclease family protein [Kribbella sp.]
MRSTVTRIVVLCAAVSAAVGLAAVPASAVADRDCGDFASQQAAQIFYLQAGGPSVDPHGLDSDGDGVACETNPAPYYYGTTLPGGAGPAQPPTSGSGGVQPTTNGNAGTSGGQATAGGSGGARLGYVVDGDTIRLANGQYVRLIGIDTPERGRPYYLSAKRNLDRLIDGRVQLVNPESVDDVDHYGRLLRYVHDGGRDTGLAQIRKGYAHARYDSLDGYDRHPMQATYRHADASIQDLW